MRLVFVTQRLDREDVILGATVAKVRALAERLDAVDVLCLSEGEHDLPSNVRVRAFGASTRFRRGLRYEAVLAQTLRGRPDGLLAHMCPIYLVLAAPLAKPLRIPLLLWYTHWTLDDTLRLATRLADAALSVETLSFPLDTGKLIARGHGIDTREFAPRDGDAGRANGELRLLALGRTSPSKGFPVLLDGLARAREAGLDATLELRGPSTTNEERGHREELLRRIAELGLEERVRLEPPLPRPHVPGLMRGFDAVVNPTRGQTRGGALDKVVYEAAASAVPVLACNPAFATLLGGLPVELRFRSGDAEDLADKLAGFGASDPAARAEAGAELRRRVEAGHSVDTWADGVVRVLARLRGQTTAVHS
jgi:glycosyltransferase involved in cell wall biosynthesis